MVRRSPPPLTPPHKEEGNKAAASLYLPLVGRSKFALANFGWGESLSECGADV